MKARIKDWLDPDYTQVYRERSARLKTLRDGVDEGSWDKAFAYYRTHPIDAIEDWLFTYDPRKVLEDKNPYMPFMLFDRQKEFVLWVLDRMDYQEEGIVEKSRDMGISWLCLAIAWWLWTFHPGAKVAFGSRVERLVDKAGDPDSLFEKFRIMVRMLPNELKPIGFSMKDHAPTLKAINPENGATLTGEGGENIGRGGRNSVYFIDESAFVENQEKVDRALSQNCPTRIHVSTVNGMGNMFAKKRHGGKHPVFIFDWREDPRKTLEWYALMQATMEPEALAQEVDRNYDATGGDTIINAMWIRASQDMYRELKKLGAEMPTEGIGGLDVAGSGSAKSVFVGLFGPWIGMPEHWNDPDTTNTAGKAKEFAIAQGCPIIKYDNIGVGAGVTAAFRRQSDVLTYGINVGNPASRRRIPNEKRRECDKFANLKASAWWGLRDAYRFTYQHWMWVQGKGGQRHDLADLILTPDHPQLAAELALPLYFHTESGKIQVETKKQLKARQIASPDFAEAVVIARCEVKRAASGSRLAGM